MDPLDDLTEPALGPEVLASLDDSKPLSPELEERIVRALRAQGTLTSTPLRRHRSAPWRRSAPWLAGAAAAVVAFIAGQATARLAPGIDGASARGEPILTPIELNVESSVDVAARQYVAALALVQSGDSAGKAAAVRTFRSAADQIVRLAPESSLALAMQIAFPASYAFAPARVEASRSPAAIIWF